MSEIETSATECHIPVEDLPVWMRQARQNVDWGILWVIFFGLIVAWPFLLRPGLPRTNASENHVFMAADYAQAFREGRLYPRWSAAALSGYGAPIPHYYPPGAAYTAAAVELLFTNDTVVAVRMVYSFGLMLAGAMTYVFVMRWAGARAGILASVLYVCSPYVGLTAPHVLGDLPGVLGLAWLPTFLWSVHRLLYTNRAFDFALVALATAALLLTVPKFLVVAGGLALMMSIWHGITHHNRRQVFWVVFAATMGIILASFYWIPAVFEQDAIRWQPPTFELPLRSLDFSSLVSPLRRIDPGEMVVTPQFTIGIAGLVFAVLGTVTILLRRNRQELHLLFLISGVVILLLGVLALPEETWLLGPAMWCLAIGGSAVAHLADLLSRHLKNVALPMLLIPVFSLSVSVWFPPQWPESYGGLSPYDQILYEQQGFGIAVLPPGENVPVTLPEATESNRILMNSYRSGEVVRVIESEGSPDNRITLSTAGTHDDRYLIETVAPTRLDILRAPFPGWKASLDDTPLTLQTNEETGFLQVDIPNASTGQLTIWLGSTPVRETAWILSWFTLGLLLVSVVLRLRIQPAIIHDDRELISVSEARLIAFVMIGLLAGILFFVIPESPYSLYPSAGYELEHTTEVHTRTDTGLEVLSYDINDKTYHIGESVEFSIAWRTSRPMLENYSVRVFLQDNIQALRWLESELRYPGGYPTRRWRTNAYVRDNYNILLTPTLRSGEYQIAVEVYSCNTECSRANRLHFFDAQGVEMGQTLILPTILTVAP